MNAACSYRCIAVFSLHVLARRYERCKRREVSDFWKRVVIDHRQHIDASKAEFQIPAGGGVCVGEQVLASIASGGADQKVLGALSFVPPPSPNTRAAWGETGAGAVGA